MQKDMDVLGLLEGEETEVIVERDAGLMQWEHDRIIVHRTTFKRMRAIGNKIFQDQKEKGSKRPEDPAADMWLLYGFYFDKGRHDQTNQPWALDTYCMKGLNWGTDKFYRIKKLLMKHEFIEQIKRTDEKGRYRKGAKGKAGAFFIKVNSMNITTSLQSPRDPYSGLTPRVGSQYTSPLTIEQEVLKRNNDNAVVVESFAKKYGKPVPTALQTEYVDVLGKCINYMIDNYEREDIDKSAIGLLTKLLKNSDDIPEPEPIPVWVPPEPESEELQEMRKEWYRRRDAHPAYQRQ